MVLDQTPGKIYINCIGYCSDLEPENCQGWVRDGYCETEASVQTNCRKSCQLCDMQGIIYLKKNCALY